MRGFANCAAFASAVNPHFPKGKKGWALRSGPRPFSVALDKSHPLSYAGPPYLALPFPDCDRKHVTLSLSLSFLICKIGPTSPTMQSCCENYNKNKAQNKCLISCDHDYPKSISPPPR